MRALYFSTVPQDAESRKSEDPTRYTLAGASVYASGVFRALLTHSTVDRIFIPNVPRAATGDLRDTRAFDDNRHRIKSIGEHQLGSLREYERVTFMSPGMALPMLSRLRRLSGCPAATVTGMIHSINYTSELQAMWMLMMAPLCRHDALMCSSTAGRQSVANFFDLLRRRLNAIGLRMPGPAFATPVIPLGVDVAAFASHPNTSALRDALDLETGPVVLYFGRLSAASKGDLFPLILAFAAVQARHSTAGLILAGDDTQFRIAESLKAFAARIAPSARVRVIANPDSAAKNDLFAMADVFVSPSDSLQETFGITVVEAMAAGIPAVVSDWNGYKDLVVHGETGFRVRTVLPQYPACFDDLRGSGAMNRPDLLAATTIVDVAELAESLSVLVGDGERRRTMGEAARARARSLYDWRVVIAACEDLWTELGDQAAADPSSGRNAWLDLEQFGYQEIFSHYPTECFGEHHYIGMSRSIVPPSEIAEWLMTTAKSAHWFRPEMFDAILSELGRHSTLHVGTLLDALGAESDMDRASAMTHVCRLMKYGVIACVDATGATSADRLTSVSTREPIRDWSSGSAMLNVKV